MCVFSHDGVLIHKFGKEGELIVPRGIATDSEGRIIVATEKPRALHTNVLIRLCFIFLNSLYFILATCL